MRNICFKQRHTSFVKWGRSMNKLFFALIFVSLLFPSVSAAHFIVGQVADAYNGVSANGYQIVIWNPVNGISDNITDVIGVTGNAATDNTYFVDCELLNNACDIGDMLRARVINNGSNYVTESTSLIVSGAGFDTMPDLRLNSPPNTTLLFPGRFANLSSSSVAFSCRVDDPDFNLANTTLYGNWSGWHANETIATLGSSTSANFSKILAEGNYQWNCVVRDNLSISGTGSENYTFRVDFSAPNITSVSVNVTSSCGNTTYVRVNCTVSDAFTGIGTVLLQAFKPGLIQNYSTQYAGNNIYFQDILLNTTGNWMFRCIVNDSAGNSAMMNSSSISVRSAEADLLLTHLNISFSTSNPYEQQITTINATVFNDGCASSGNFLVGFYENDPASGGLQINGNRTLSLSSQQSATVNVSWSSKIGPNNIFVLADVNNSVSEFNESNNKANRSINVGAWQIFYGNASITKLLASYSLSNFTLWPNSSQLSGGIFVSDMESTIQWSSLQAFGRNASGGIASNDYADLDTLFNMSTFNDSIRNTFTSDGSTPKTLTNASVYKRAIANIPIINSTNTSAFHTGILWDSSDDTNGQFDLTNHEDVVFMTAFNGNTAGAYGFYDYEIRVPVRLRDYYTTNSADLYFYFDLN